MARKGKSTKTKINCLAYGKPFSGKSTFALGLMRMKNEDGRPFRVLYLDAENGSVDDYIDDLEREGINPDNLYIVYTQSLEAVVDYINKVRSKEKFYVIDEEGNETDEVLTDADGLPFMPDAVVVDGTSVLNMAVKQGLTDMAQARANIRAKEKDMSKDERFVAVTSAGLEIKDYNIINFKGQDLVLALTGSGVHYVITAREKDETKNVGKGSKIEMVHTGKTLPDGFKEMAYNVKTVLHFYRDEEDETQVCVNVEKDRTGTYAVGETIVDPQILAFQKMINRNKDKEDYVIKNTIDDAVRNAKEVAMQEQFDGIGGSTTDVSVDTDKNGDDEKQEVLDYITAARGKCNATQKQEVQDKLKEQKLTLKNRETQSLDTLKQIKAIFEEVLG